MSVCHAPGNLIWNLNSVTQAWLLRLPARDWEPACFVPPRPSADVESESFISDCNDKDTARPAPAAQAIRPGMSDTVREHLKPACSYSSLICKSYSFSIFAHLHEVQFSDDNPADWFCSVHIHWTATDVNPFRVFLLVQFLRSFSCRDSVPRFRFHFRKLKPTKHPKQFKGCWAPWRWAMARNGFGKVMRCTICIEMSVVYRGILMLLLLHPGIFNRIS